MVEMTEAMKLTLAAAVFLPLFPLSIIYNQLFTRLNNPWLRAILLLIWPQIGIIILTQVNEPIPDWFITWALATAAFYAFRSLALREAGVWMGFIATSAWTLLWLDTSVLPQLQLIALGFSLPLVLMAFVTGAIVKRVGAAHTELGGGLAIAAPRLSALFVIAILASVATPIFPAFFTLLATLLEQIKSSPETALVLVLIWLLWTWSGARLLQGIVVGTPQREDVKDIGMFVTWVYSIGFIALAYAGIELAGVLL